RRHRLFLPPLVRWLRFAAMLRCLLVSVVLELFLANGLLDFFRRHDGGGLPLRPTTVPHPLAALAPSPRGRGERLTRFVAARLVLARVVLALLSAAPLRFG